MCFAGSLCLFLSVLLILYVLWCVFHSYEYLLFDFVLSCSSLLSRPPSAWSVLFSPEHLHCPPFLRLSASLILARLCPLVLSLLYYKVFRFYANLTLMYFDTKFSRLALALQEFAHYAQGSPEDSLSQ